MTYHSLHSAKAAYQSERYPGDLAAELLPPAAPTSFLQIGMRLGAGTMAAAVAGLALWLIQPTDLRTPLAPAPAIQSAIHLEVPALPTLSEWPEYLTIAPPIEKMIPRSVSDWFKQTGRDPELRGDPDRPA